MRNTGDVKLKLFGNRELALSYVGLARKMLGELQNYNHDLSPITRDGVTTRSRVLQDGTVIKVTHYPWQPVIEIFAGAPPARKPEPEKRQKQYYAAIGFNGAAFIANNGHLYTAGRATDAQWVDIAPGHTWKVLVGDTYMEPFYAIRDDDTLWAFDHSTSDAPWPPQQLTSGSWTNVIAHGFGVVVAQRTDGSLWLVGDSDFEGFSFIGDTAQISPGNDWVWFTGNYWQTFASKPDGSLWIAGWHSPRGAWTGGGFQSGAGSARSTMEELITADGVLAGNSLGERNTRYNDGKNKCWGGMDTCVVIAADGTLWYVADSPAYQKGYAEHWTLLSPDTDWDSITNDGWPHALLTKRDGSLWALGVGGYGRATGTFGLGFSNNEADTPVLVSSDRWAHISAEGDFTFLGVKADGTLWGWGADWDGQVGACGADNVGFPTQIGEDSDWAWALPRAYASCAFKRDGSFWVWGGNYWGRLGTPDSFDFWRFCGPNPVIIDPDSLEARTELIHGAG